MDFSMIRGAQENDESSVGNDLRSELRNEATDRARLEALKARARASEEGEVVKQRLGETMFDLMEEYFPEETASRRRQHMAKAFFAGVVVGLGARYLWNRD